MAILNFNFLNVGHGDSTVIINDEGTPVMIDINVSQDYGEKTIKDIEQQKGFSYLNNFEARSKYNNFLEYLKSEKPEIYKELDKSLENPIEFLKSKTNSQITNLTYMQTHPDLDHMQGLFGLSTDDKITISSFIDTAHSITKEFKDDNNSKDWEEYQKLRTSNICKKMYYGDFLTIDEVNYYFFHPTEEAVVEASESGNCNLTSLLILVEYKGVKVVLGGDVDTASWISLYNRVSQDRDLKELFSNIYLLKASHHGRKSGKCDKEGSRNFLNLMNPQTVIISIGEKNLDFDATDWYRKRPDESYREIYQTVYCGNVYMEINNDGKIYIDTEKDRKDKDLPKIIIPTTPSVIPQKLWGKN